MAPGKIKKSKEYMERFEIKPVTGTSKAISDDVPFDDEIPF
jgi:hypothetical protein